MIVWFKAGHIIYSEKDYANEIYFIKSGKINFVLEEYENWPYINIKAGNYFGEVDVLLGQHRKLRAMVEKNTVLYVLKAEHFNEIFIHQFPNEGKKFFNKIVRKRTNQLKARNDSINYCKN